MHQNSVWKSRWPLEFSASACPPLIPFWLTCPDNLCSDLAWVPSRRWSVAHNSVRPSPVFDTRSILCSQPRGSTPRPFGVFLAALFADGVAHSFERRSWITHSSNRVTPSTPLLPNAELRHTSAMNLGVQQKQARNPPTTPPAYSSRLPDGAAPVSELVLTRRR